MAVHCALNGDYIKADHPLVPVTVEEVVADVRACRAAGAVLVHVHPRGAAGRQTLETRAHDGCVRAVREAVPGLEISCSTVAGIDLGDAPDRASAVRAWHHPPDVVSLNLEEDGAVELGAVLLECGIGIEAGLFTLADADRLLTAPWADRITRVLVEVIYETDDHSAVALAAAIDERVASLGKPRVWHGEARASWAVVAEGHRRGHDVRVGLEDSLLGPDGGPAPHNAAQVALVTGA